MNCRKTDSNFTGHVAGQSIKDIVKWPRPKCPPVVRLQKKWAMEYGMPSTHAMVGVAFPAGILYFSSHIPVRNFS